MPVLPSISSVTEWLRANVRKEPPGTLARWCGEERDFSYDISDPRLVESGFFERWILFSVRGERGLLPFPALPSGSWGIFAHDGAAILPLMPDDDSFDRLLRHEGRGLEAADPERFAQLLCDVRLADRSCRGHTVVDSPDFIRGLGRGYGVDESELMRVEDRIVGPTILRADAGGWDVVFSTIFGWMHEKHELGLERVTIDEQFVVHRHERDVLSERIFVSTPCLKY